MSERTEKPGLLDLTAMIVSAHVGNNDMRAEALPDLIGSVHQALTSVGGAAGGTRGGTAGGLADDRVGRAAASVPAAAVKPAAERPEPAVPIKKSVFSDYLICLEDGKKLKMLKRHLMTSYGMTAEDYRARWDLPENYPMVAPSYAQKRSTLAKAIGLGRKRVSGAETDARKAETRKTETRQPDGRKYARRGRPPRQ